MSERHTLETPGVDNFPYWLTRTNAGWQTTVWDLRVKTRRCPVDILDNGVIIYGDPKPVGIFCGAPIYAHPRPIVYRDDYRPRHVALKIVDAGRVLISRRLVIFENEQWWRYGYNHTILADDTDTEVYPCKQVIV